VGTGGGFGYWLSFRLRTKKVKFPDEKNNLEEGERYNFRGGEVPAVNPIKETSLGKLQKEKYILNGVLSYDKGGMKINREREPIFGKKRGNQQWETHNRHGGGGVISIRGVGRNVRKKSEGGGGGTKPEGGQAQRG